MGEIRTAGDLRGFLADIMVGIRDGTVDNGQAHAISKVAAQINNSLAVEVNTALQLERMGQDRPIAGTMLIGNAEPEAEAARPVDQAALPPGKDVDGQWAKEIQRQLRRCKTKEEVTGIIAENSHTLERIMAERPETHSEISAAFDAALLKVRPKIKPDEMEDGRRWCGQCDKRVLIGDAQVCLKTFCPFV